MADPCGNNPSDGAFVRYPSADLLDILALESVRHGAVVVGEDLGTVEESARSALADHHVLSYRLLWFEDEPPARWPPNAMAAVTTHDLPDPQPDCGRAQISPSTTRSGST